LNCVSLFQSEYPPYISLKLNLSLFPWLDSHLVCDTIMHNSHYWSCFGQAVVCLFPIGQIFLAKPALSFFCLPCLLKLPPS
jgi:hypothetical protein